MKSIIIKQLRYWLCIILMISNSISGYSDNKKDAEKNSNSDKRSQILKAITLAEQLEKEDKTKKAITELEKILPTAETLNNEVLLERTYELLSIYNKKINNKKKAAEYNTLYNITKTAREKKELEIKKEELEKKNKKTEILLSRSTTAINNLEEEKKITAQVIDSTTNQLLMTQDSLSILDLINRERQSQITLLNKEKQLKDLKVKEQELIIKEEEARKHFTWVIIGSLVLGLMTLSTLAFYIYKNLQQKKEYSHQIEEQLGLIQHQHEHITQSINYAQRIQNAMLPTEHNLTQLIPDSFILFKPKDIVSGDFYWFYNAETGKTISELDPDQTSEHVVQKIIIAAVDCTGHGVPGAFMSMIGYNLLDMIASKHTHEPHLILSELNRSVQHALQQQKSNNKDGMDMAICSIDKSNKIIEFAGAKNPMIVIKNGELEVFKGDKDSVGGAQGDANRTYTKHSIHIDQPTTIYLFSDGYEDQFGGTEGKKFMIKNLRDLLLKIHQEPFEKQKEILNQTLEAWKGTKEKQIDDILVIGMRVG